MSEEENINQPKQDSPQPAENENVSEENIQHTTLNTQDNEEIMEAHKHPQYVTKKKCGEYQLEFYKLFHATL